ncbi:MAG: hypothetical protein K6T81_00575 [Alicyclobacillus macrosporangiidus]|uniref:hypothetical protein n=1 Tax=Alicyclobacillus macrosporangiidus TaxID=392015 RepID=UPI0026F18D28|nr:hypothetical protein [Alicyclobacillus macrosporangiidus]MCL6597215.1 hypothetical protein [Alicyclobacillus macrosporangiidus]
MAAGRGLVWLGVVVMLIELLSNLRNMVFMAHTLVNVGAAVGSPLWQGGTLIGIGKILEALQSRGHDSH